MDTKILSGHEVQIIEIREEVEAAARVMLQANGIPLDDLAYPQRLYESMTIRYRRLLLLPERQRDRDHILTASQVHLQLGVPEHTRHMQPPLSQAPLQPPVDTHAISLPSVQFSMRPSTGNRPLPPVGALDDMQQAPAHYATQHPPFQVTAISRTLASTSAATNTVVQPTIPGSNIGSLASNAHPNPMTLPNYGGSILTPSSMARRVAAANAAAGILPRNQALPSHAVPQPSVVLEQDQATQKTASFGAQLSASAGELRPIAQDYQQSRQRRDGPPAPQTYAQRVPRTITPQDQRQRYLRVLLRGDFQESENILTQIATSESETAAGGLLRDANIHLARAVHYLATRCVPGSGASLTGQVSHAQEQVPPTASNIPQTGLIATSNRTAGKIKHDLSPQSRNQVHSQSKRRRNTTAGLRQWNRDAQSARGGMYHSFGHNPTSSRPHVASIGTGTPTTGPWSIIPKAFYGLVPEYPFGSSWYFECAKCPDAHPRRENTFLEHMRKPTHYGPLFVLIDVEEETRDWVARPDYHHTKEVRGRMVFDVGYSLTHKDTGSKTPSCDDAAHRPTGEGDIKYKDKQPHRLWGRELLARRTGGSMLVPTMPDASAPTRTEEDVINISSDSDNDEKLTSSNGDRAGPELGAGRVDNGRSAVRPQSAGVFDSQDRQSTRALHGPDPPETPAQVLFHATFPNGWERIPTFSGQDNRCGSNAIVNSFASNVDLPSEPPTADEIIAIMRSPSFTDLEVGFINWDAPDDEGQQTEGDGVGFRIDRLGLALSLWSRQTRNLHVRLGVVVQNGPTYVLSYEDGGEHADGSTVWIYNDNARAIIGLPTVNNHYEGITARIPATLGPNPTGEDVVTEARQGDGSESDDGEDWQDDSTRFRINLDKVRRKSA